METYALGGGLWCLINVHAVDGGALGVWGGMADSVVEDDDFFATSAFLQELDDGRVVVRGDAFVGGPVDLRVCLVWAW